MLANDGKQASFRWVCPRCGEAVKEFVALQERGSMVEATCKACHYGVQVRAFVTEEAEGGKPGSGRGRG